MLEGIEMPTVIPGSIFQAVPPIKFNVDLMECVVTATMENQECQDPYNPAKEGNPGTNVEYFYSALYYKGRL
jgi:hypothetical protein